MPRVVTPSARALLSLAVTGREEGLTEIGISQNSLSTMEYGKVEIEAEILLKIGREFGKRASRIRRYIDAI